MLIPTLASVYKVDINLDKETLQELKNYGYILYGFRAVESWGPGGRPVVWFATDAYLENTTVCWAENYGAYISTDEPNQGADITGRINRPIKLGQIMNVDEDSICTVRSGGRSGYVSIRNKGTHQFTCGISDRINNDYFRPICEFVLYGGKTVEIKPVQTILLVFSTEHLTESTVIDQLLSPGILIDLEGADTREVGYDINEGWNWNNEIWAEEIPAGTAIPSLLVKHPTERRIVKGKKSINANTHSHQASRMTVKPQFFSSFYTVSHEYYGIIYLILNTSSILT
jgi:hypothetical protein